MWERLRDIFSGEPAGHKRERRNRLRVLLVDDSAFIRLVLSRRLAQHPRIEIVGDASGAGEALKRIHDSQPDVIVLDMEMPRGTGLDLLQALEPEQRARCLLFSSLHPDDRSLRECRRLGVGGILRKCTRDFDLESLVQRLIEAILQVEEKLRSR